MKRVIRSNADLSYEEKIAWLQSADSEQLVNQFYSAIVRLTKSSLSEQIEAQEDYDIIKAELLKRLRWGNRKSDEVVAPTSNGVPENMEGSVTFNWN